MKKKLISQPEETDALIRVGITSFGRVEDYLNEALNSILFNLNSPDETPVYFDAEGSAFYVRMNIKSAFIMTSILAHGSFAYIHVNATEPVILETLSLAGRLAKI